jgi:hypothetical protein
VTRGDNWHPITAPHVQFQNPTPPRPADLAPHYRPAPQCGADLAPHYRPAGRTWHPITAPHANRSEVFAHFLIFWENLTTFFCENLTTFFWEKLTTVFWENMTFFWESPGIVMGGRDILQIFEMKYYYFPKNFEVPLLHYRYRGNTASFITVTAGNS